MKRCYDSKIDRISAMLCIPLFSVIGCFYFVMGINFLITSRNETIVLRVCYVAFVILGITFIVFGVLFSLFALRKYELSEKGIVIQYTNKHAFFYSWNDLRLVCVLATYQEGGSQPKDVIWCATKKVMRVPPEKLYFHTSWITYFFHRKEILTIAYSEERLEEFKRYYNENIPDYRYLSAFE